jgi:hypothetical protein
MAITKRNKQATTAAQEIDLGIGLLFLLTHDENGVYSGHARLKVGDDEWKVLDCLMPSDELGSVEWVDTIWRELPDLVGSVLIKRPDDTLRVPIDRATYSGFREVYMSPQFRQMVIQHDQF